MQGVAIMCREYTYFWPTFNGALVAEISPNSVFWYLFFKIFLGGMPPDPPSFSMAHLHHQKGPLFLEKNLPTLTSAYGPDSYVIKYILAAELQASGYCV